MAKYLDVKDLSAELGVSVQTLYKWRSEGTDMPRAFMIGRSPRWRQDVVDAWIDEQELKAAA